MWIIKTNNIEPASQVAELVIWWYLLEKRHCRELDIFVDLERIKKACRIVGITTIIGRGFETLHLHH